jgi:hypothetical protein
MPTIVAPGAVCRSSVRPAPWRRLAPLLAAAFAVAAISAVLRFYRLSDLLPVLVDEAIYLRWAEIIDHQGEWFISLLDGKQPLSYWLLFAMRRIGPADPLIGGRLTSAVAGVLTTLAIFGFGGRLAGWSVGAGAALFYAVLPYAVLFDRVAYTDALANLCVLLVAWTSYEAFRSCVRPWPWTIAAALALGVGAMVKTTVLQFSLFPVVFGLLYCRRRPGLLSARLMLIYAVPAALLALTSALRPPGPRFSPINPLIHRSDFFLSFGELAAVGPDLMRFNVDLASGYLDAYVTAPLVIAAVLGTVCIWLRRDLPLLIVLLASMPPLLVQMALLRYYPSRYLFAYAWVLVMAAAYLVALSGRAGHALRIVLLVALVLKTLAFFGDTAASLHPRDAAEFMSSGPYSGFGVREASQFLMREADAGGFMLLTDPYWGPPADAMFAYVQGKKGIVVHEAWWLRVEEEQYPIVPVQPMPIMKSHYQRIPAGTIDFSSCCPRVYYVTDTNYYSEDDVRARQPEAHLAARFMKPNRRDSIDIYRIR